MSVEPGALFAPNTSELTTSLAIGQLAAALAKAQATFPKIERKRTAEITHRSGGKHSYTYADLADVLDAVRPRLADQELALVQPIVTRDGRMVLVTRLVHSSGEWIESTYPLAAGSTPQDTGAAITYARRYAATALLGIATEEDIDGPRQQAKQQRATNAGAGGRGSASQPQISKLHAVAKNRNVTDEQLRKLAYAKWPGCEGHLSKLTGGRDGQASALIEFLEKSSDAQLGAAVAKAAAKKLSEEPVGGSEGDAGSPAGPEGEDSSVLR